MYGRNHGSPCESSESVLCASNVDLDFSFYSQLDCIYTPVLARC